MTDRNKPFHTPEGRGVVASLKIIKGRNWKIIDGKRVWVDKVSNKNNGDIS